MFEIRKSDYSFAAMFMQSSLMITDISPTTAREFTSIYVHIPFCRTRCTYCAFNTYTGMNDSIPAYVGALCHEMTRVAQHHADTKLAVHTVYFGGGTPSLLHPDQVTEILEICHTRYDVQAQAEVTLEANPGTISSEALRQMRLSGINRLSLGVQSSKPDHLRRFGRGHTFEEAQQAFVMAREAGFTNISVDLIFGIPTQTLVEWEETLTSVMAWQPDHISLYSLMIETGTPLAQQIDLGSVAIPDPDLAADMYEMASNYLRTLGYLHYEISNWARPGSECLHNLQYWLNKPYLGFGAGAHGSVNNLRYWNVNPIPAYLQRMNQSERLQFPFSSALESFENIDISTQMSETMMLGLRLPQYGVSRAGFIKQFDVDVSEVFPEALNELSSAGWILISDNAVRLSERALLVSNQIMRRFIL
jgi:oxygen-independent coproporphyrinogen-3 oxidase